MSKIILLLFGIAFVAVVEGKPHYQQSYYGGYLYPGSYGYQQPPPQPIYQSSTCNGPSYYPSQTPGTVQPQSFPPPPLPGATTAAPTTTYPPPPLPGVTTGAPTTTYPPPPLPGATTGAPTTTYPPPPLPGATTTPASG